MADASAQAEGSSAEWRSLQPLSLLVNLLPDLWRTGRASWPLLVAFLVGGTVQGAINLGLLFLFFGLSVSRTVLHVATLRYRLHEGKLEILSGLIGRQHRVIDPARIQNVEIVQNVFHKLAGLVELRIETAGERGVEGLLSAISVAEAERLRHELAVRIPPAAEGDEVRTISLAELAGYGVSAGRVGAVLVGVGLFTEVMGQLDPTHMGQIMANQGSGTMLGLGLVGMAIAYVTSVVTAILRFQGFRLVRTARGIATESGLFTRRRVEIPASKVQVVHVDEPVLRRWMGYASLRIDTAAGFNPGDPMASEALVPMVGADDISVVLGLVYPAAPPELFEARLTPASPRALRRQLVAATIRYGVLGLVVGQFVTWWLAPVPVVWGLVTAALGWRYQGWAQVGSMLVVREGWLSRRTAILPLEKVQSVHLAQGPVLRRYRLGRVELWASGLRLGIPDLDEEEARALFERLGQRLAM